MHRRSFLAAAGVVGVGGLAGCSSPVGTGESSGTVAVSEPAVDDRALERGGWVRSGELEEQVLDTSVSFVDVEGYSHTTLYENRALRERLTEGTMGAFDATVMQFFASRIELDPAVDDLPLGLGLDQILSRMRERAEATFVDRLREQGLSDPRVTDRAVPDLEHERATTYAAAYEYEPMEVSLTDDEALTVPGGSLPVRGLVSVWKGEGALFVAGGACPGANFSESVRREVTDAVTVTVDVDLELTPDRYWRELQGLTNGVR